MSAWSLAVRCGDHARALMHTVMSILRELSDENAYARFLADGGRPHSAAAWREFSDTRARAKYVRPRCC
jgi:hypothetical protein